jgi:hypothetical protein
MMRCCVADARSMPHPPRRRGSGGTPRLPARPTANRGEAYRAKGDNDRAIADYNVAIRLDPKDAFA